MEFEAADDGEILLPKKNDDTKTNEFKEKIMKLLNNYFLVKCTQLNYTEVKIENNIIVVQDTNRSQTKIVLEKEDECK